VRSDEAAARRVPSGRSIVGALVAAVVALAGGGGAGYYARSASGESAPLERVSALERWQAAKVATDAIEAQQRTDFVLAIRDMTATNASVRDAVIALTERMGAMDARLQAVERAGSVQAAGGHR